MANPAHVTRRHLMVEASFREGFAVLDCRAVIRRVVVPPGRSTNSQFRAHVSACRDRLQPWRMPRKGSPPAPARATKTGSTRLPSVSEAGRSRPVEAAIRRGGPKGPRSGPSSPTAHARPAAARRELEDLRAAINHHRREGGRSPHRKVHSGGPLNRHAILGDLRCGPDANRRPRVMSTSNRECSIAAPSVGKQEAVVALGASMGDETP